ncbi:protein Hook homolog 3-like, partial [Lethenteron reissneri]|uniref:protein Hook homolog 3-like n=1 Tax=Lethenteron reissneri TaxID=7753 RepID=UPI002AB7E0C8
MRIMEERYKRYLEKAKSVIRTLDPKQNPGSVPESQSLRNQLLERDRLIMTKERESERVRMQRDQEEKLIVSAWYSLGLSLQRKSSDLRLVSTGPGQSFL